jgi:hypothetical protein
MSRDELKERLVSNGFDETLADEWLKSIPDEDLERIKEDNVVELFKEALAEAAKEDKKPDEEEDKPMDVEMKDGMVKCKCGQRLRIRAGQEKETPIELDFSPLTETIKTAIAAQFKEVDIELPDFDARLTSLETALKDLATEMHRQVEDAAAELVKESSAATKSRLVLRWHAKEQKEKPQEEPVIGTGIKNADGKEFSTVSDMFLGEDGE